MIDIFSAPRFDYDDSLNKLVLIPGEASAIGNCDDAVNLLRNRLKFVTQVGWSHFYFTFIYQFLIALAIDRSVIFWSGL